MKGQEAAEAKGLVKRGSSGVTGLKQSKNLGKVSNVNEEISKKSKISPMTVIIFALVLMSAVLFARVISVIIRVMTKH